MTVALLTSVPEAQVASTFEQAAGRLDSAGAEIVFDFSAVRRIDASALHSMESFHAIASEKDVRVILRNVTIDVYKVLKLMKMASRFTFAN